MKRESKIVRCKDCNQFICVNTENGILIGNVIIEELSGECSCGKDIYIRRLYKESEINIKEQLSL